MIFTSQLVHTHAAPVILSREESKRAEELQIKRRQYETKIFEDQCEKDDNMNNILTNINTIYNNCILPFLNCDTPFYNHNLFAKLTRDKFTKWVIENNDEIYDLFSQYDN